MTIENLREWNLANKKKTNAYRQAWTKRWRQRIKAEAMTYYGGKCVCCEEDTMKFLTIDHLDGDGAQHRKSLKGTSIYVWLLKNGCPPGFQVLCFNCNCGRALNGGVCPHKDSDRSIENLSRVLGVTDYNSSDY